MSSRTGLTAITFSPSQQAALDRACARGLIREEEYDGFLALLAGASFEEAELLLCALDRQYFITEYCKIYDPESANWIPFILWPEQIEVLDLFIDHQMLAALKARQLGLTWLFVAIALHEGIFRPIAEILFFSKREDEAIYLLSEERLRGMYYRLPEWMRPDLLIDAKKHMMFANGSNFRAFPSNAGDAYTATLAIIDEADLVPDLGQLLKRVEPTIEAGGKLALISRADKARPLSLFKNIYRQAKRGLNKFVAIFLPWYVHPDRDQEWYERQRRNAIENEGTLDTIYEQYPATDTEALAASTLHKRILPAWLDQCYEERKPLSQEELPRGAPSIPGLVIFRPPERSHQYVGGMDCAEGLPSSKDSATTFIDRHTGEEVANLVGKLTPAVHAAYSAHIAEWYNGAALMVENNNHGHAAILWLNDNGYKHLVLPGHNNKDGWSSNTLGKALLYDAISEAAKNSEVIIHDFETKMQLLSIEKATLRAPEGEMEDRADSFALAVVARPIKPRSTGPRRVAVSGLYPSRQRR